MNIGFIGTGNMGGAIMEGYKDGALADGHRLFGYARNEERLLEICNRCHGAPCQSIGQLVDQCQIVFLGVKPNGFEEVLPLIREYFTSDKVLVSMAAGISINYIQSYLGPDASIIRIMPNTPAKVGMAMTSVSPSPQVTMDQLNLVRHIMMTIGKAQVVDESQIHTVIGLSGSSPAYTYMYIDALATAAAAEGMDKEQALTFAAQAVLGAAQMILTSEEDPATLTQRVCSPGGTTIEAVNTLRDNGFQANVTQGFKAAVAKSKRMEK